MCRTAYEDGRTVGTQGSEGGGIIKNEEYFCGAHNRGGDENGLRRFADKY